VALAASRAQRRPPKFDAASFCAEYNAAFHKGDLRFSEELFSSDFWLGRQFPSRAAALMYLRGLFSQYADVDAQLQVENLRRIAGGRALIVDATLHMTGRRPGETAYEEISDTIGSSFFVCERGRWRIYKNIERLSSLAAE
jgi:hypothetical protein